MKLPLFNHLLNELSKILAEPCNNIPDKQQYVKKNYDKHQYLKYNDFKIVLVVQVEKLSKKSNHNKPMRKD